MPRKRCTWKSHRRSFEAADSVPGWQAVRCVENWKLSPVMGIINETFDILVWWIVGDEQIFVRWLRTNTLPHFAPMDIPIVQQEQNLSARCWPSVKCAGGWDMKVIFPLCCAQSLSHVQLLWQHHSFYPAQLSVHLGYLARILELGLPFTSKGIFPTQGSFTESSAPEQIPCHWTTWGPLFSPLAEVLSVCDKAKAECFIRLEYALFMLTDHM